MEIVKPSVVIDPFSPDIIMRALEVRGRVCYKSEDRITEDSADKFIRDLIKRGHESVIEHEKLSVRIITDRGVTHEIVRHRIGSYSQESTRYCNYKGGVAFIEPFFFKEGIKQNIWYRACFVAEQSYLDLLKAGASPQEARSVLPNSLKTEIEVTFNLREWRHFLRLRCSSAAHPQMQQVAIPILLYLKRQLPAIFDNIPHNINFPTQHYAEVDERSIW